MPRPALRLDPVRLAFPGVRRMARWAVVAVLLALAAGVLYANPGGCAGPSGVPGQPGMRSAQPATATPTSPGAIRIQPATTPAAPGSSALADPAVAGIAAIGVPAGMAGVTVRLADPAIVAVLRPGAQVDLVATGSSAATAAVVLATVPGVAFEDPGAAAAFVGVSPQAARELANAPADLRFRVIVRTM